MKNITLSIEEDVLQEARKIAAERGTTVNAMVRASLAEVVRQRKRTRDALKRMRELAEEGGMEVGKETWRRDDLHER
jgi:antitoxin component of RelBE/YafQ-DinJ toxin-antitoxin module